MNLGNILFFSLPILLGAAIGLFTNWLAIKMLFRPLREYRLLGIKVPFTPGILPRERARIAQSLGQTVADDLLTKDAVVDRLRSPEFRDGLEKALYRVLSSLSLTGLDGLGSGLSPELGRLLKDMAVRAVRSIALTDGFSQALETSLGQALSLAEELPLEPIAQSEPVAALSRRLAQEPTRDALADALAKALARALISRADRGGTLGELLDLNAVAEGARGLADALYESAVAQFVESLSHDPIRESLEKAAATLLRKALDRFNSFQRFFISLGQYDKAIMENVPAVVGDFLDSLRAMALEAKTRAAALDALASLVLSLGNRRLSELGVFSGAEAGERLAGQLGTVMKSLASRLEPDSLSALLGGLARGRSLGDLLALAPELRESLAHSLTAWISRLLSGEESPSESVKGVARGFYGQLAGFLRGGTIGGLLALEDDGLKRLSSLVSGPLAELAAKESASILATLDIRAMVVAKIDALDMIEVERMLLRVIDRELAAVTWFGALLGAIIGLAQSLISLAR